MKITSKQKTTAQTMYNQFGTEKKWKLSWVVYLCEKFSNLIGEVKNLRAALEILLEPFRFGVEWIENGTLEFFDFLLENNV
jgi:hypothetical protein